MLMSVPLAEFTIEVEMVERNSVQMGADFINPSVSSRTSKMNLVELAQAIEKADTILKANATSQLKLLMEQILHLQSQAYDVMQNLKISSELHHAACYFEKVPGKVYYLYCKPSGLKYFSMLSPDDWSGIPPHKFLGAYKLETDMTWTPLQHVALKSRTDDLISRIIDSNLADHSDKTFLEEMITEN